MEVWFYFRIETTAERPTRRAEGRKEFTLALLPKRVRRAFALLTKTYHGSRITSDLRTKTDFYSNHLLSSEFLPDKVALISLDA